MKFASSEQLQEDDRVRVTRWSFAAEGESTGHHVHEFDYLVVPITGGAFTVESADGGTREMTQIAGASYFGTAGTAHNVICAAGPATFVEVELKS